MQRYNFPRSDLRVTVKGADPAVLLQPSFALGGWIALHRIGVGDTFMAMGDLVLTEDEITPVITALQAGGIEQSALHQHVLSESPRVSYVHVHVHAMGDAVTIGLTLRTASALTKVPPAVVSAATSTVIDLDTAAVARIPG